VTPSTRRPDDAPRDTQSRDGPPEDLALDAAPWPVDATPGDDAVESEVSGPETADPRRRRRGRLAPEPELFEAAPTEAPPTPPPALDPAARKAATEALEARILSHLNPEQARAVTTTEGPVLILAGAGSGKTRVLAHRVAYLIGVMGIRPWQILAVTFTNRAAGELRERIIALVGPEAGKEVEAGTFHSLCARVLRRDGEAIGVDRRFVIYDADDQQQLMKQILREEGIDAKGETRPAAILGAVSRAKNEMLDPGELPPLRLAPPQRGTRSNACGGS